MAGTDNDDIVSQNSDPSAIQTPRPAVNSWITMILDRVDPKS
jgi:hypothetical protein